MQKAKAQLIKYNLMSYRDYISLYKGQIEISTKIGAKLEDLQRAKGIGFSSEPKGQTVSIDVRITELVSDLCESEKLEKHYREKAENVCKFIDENFRSEDGHDMIYNHYIGGYSLDRIAEDYHTTKSTISKRIENEILQVADIVF